MVADVCSKELATICDVLISLVPFSNPMPRPKPPYIHLSNLEKPTLN